MSLPMIIDFLTEMNIQQIRKHCTPFEVQNLPQDEVVELAQIRANRSNQLEFSADAEGHALAVAKQFNPRKGGVHRSFKMRTMTLNRTRNVLDTITSR